jgi:predicted lactoylglutathione lyase
MKKQIILNLPVKNLDKSKAFFSALGFTFDDRFSGENAAFMHIVEGTIQAMLTTESFFQSLIDKPLSDAKQANELVICLSCESREEVDSLIAMASCTTRASRISMAICGIWCGRRRKPESVPVTGSFSMKPPVNCQGHQIQSRLTISGLAGDAGSFATTGKAAATGLAAPTGLPATSSR